jgi:hypothetical protein
MKSRMKMVLSVTLLFVLTSLVLPFISDAYDDKKNVQSQTVYWSGWVKLSDGKSFETRTFSLPRKPVVLDFEKYATGKDASFSIELEDAEGKTVDMCVGDAYVSKIGRIAKCYFDEKRKVGKYSLKFTNHTVGSVLEIPTYVLKGE